MCIVPTNHHPVYGDSGSWVVTGSSVLGMLVASHDLLSIGYFIPINQIFANISAALCGSEVTLYESIAQPLESPRSVEVRNGPSAYVSLQDSAENSSTQRTTSSVFDLSSLDALTTSTINMASEAPERMNERLSVDESSTRLRHPFSHSQETNSEKAARTLPNDYLGKHICCRLST